VQSIKDFFAALLGKAEPYEVVFSNDPKVTPTR
jgi:hypothetical protein